MRMERHGEERVLVKAPAEKTFALGTEMLEMIQPSVLFKVSGANSTTEGTYTLFVQSVSNPDENPARDVGDTRSSAFELPFPTIFFDDFALPYESLSFLHNTRRQRLFHYRCSPKSGLIR